MAPVNDVAQVLASSVGGLGLFLLGMTMMTDGLRLAAGPALERILASATRTRWHALGSGVLVTSLVQSSSAVTVAVIGFVNAGLLPLGPALWVLFGANVGTTMTGWIVALVGLKFKIEVLALPLVGVGVALRLTGAEQRRGALGSALAGFGLLFMGIGLLQQAFTGLATQVSLPEGEGPLAVVLQVLVGTVLTVLMQSSSASMAIALTAAQQGLLTAQGAAAVVIGANLGTTVTAVLAAIGATPNARRAAVAHVLFNGITAVVALLLLPWLIGALATARAALGLPPDPAAKLALFHTVFNLMGVALMWPLADALTRQLQRCFRAAEEDEGRPRHLDDTVLAVPLLALDALSREVDRIGALARRLVGQVLRGQAASPQVPLRQVLERLDHAADAFAERIARASMSPMASARMADVLRVQRYYRTAVARAAEAAALGPGVAHPPHWPAERFVQAALEMLAACEPGVPAYRSAEAQQAMEQHYQDLKSQWLRAAAQGQARMEAMEAGLDQASALRHALQQLGKARQRSVAWDAALATDGATDRPISEAQHG